MEWFTVDRKGLAKLLERKGVAHVVLEPLANAFDERVTRVEVTLQRVRGTRRVELIVADDSPEGFADLSHAYRLFAESKKKGLAEARGRFNLGDKLVLAMCDSASIASTTGTVIFDAAGRKTSREKTAAGSVFRGQLRMTDKQLAECKAVLGQVLVPEHVTTWFNGSPLPSRSPLAQIDARLQTETANADGILRRGLRSTTVSIYEPLASETPTLYELGMPVCSTGDRYHVSIGQKVPLDLERSGVPAAFLARVRGLVLEAMHGALDGAEASAPWVREALHHNADTLPVEAVRRVVELRFGGRAVAFDPSDAEANHLAASQGYRVVPGGSMSGSEWAAVRRSGALLPAGRVTPSPRPFSDSGEPLKLLDPSRWTPSMRATADYARSVGGRLLDKPINVAIASDVTWPFVAAYGAGRLIFNLGRLGHQFFDGPLEAKNNLLIHELGHDSGSSHLSAEYHEALTRLGAKLVQLALEEPVLFARAAARGPTTSTAEQDRCAVHN